LTFTVATGFVPIAGCAHVPAYNGSDLVVFGTVETLNYEAIDELAMNGRFTARLTINRVDKGRPPSSLMTIKYIAHADFERDREFRFHLQRSHDGTWLACKDQGVGYICR